MRPRSLLAALPLAAALAALADDTPGGSPPIPLSARVRAPVEVVPEVVSYRLEQDGAAVGRAVFEYAHADDGAIELRAEVERVAGPLVESQRSAWAFTPALALVRFEEELEARVAGDPRPIERRTLRGEATGGVVRSTFEIPGLPPRTLEAVVPPNAIARYAAGLALADPENLVPGAAYVHRQLSPRSGGFATVLTRVLEGPREGTFLLETTSDEAPELLVRTVVAPRSAAHPNGAALHSEQRLPGGRSVVLVREGD